VDGKRKNGEGTFIENKSSRLQSSNSRGKERGNEQEPSEEGVGMKMWGGILGGSEGGEI